MSSYVTLSETMNDLRKQGYNEDFNLRQSCLECGEKMLSLSADDFKVDQFFRFEGETDPSDESILYAISSERFGIKGLLVNGYGIYSESLTDDMVARLKTH
ncbi:MAG: phosphoribosylpyrophosphate synthetase [Chitinophagaceae bacterium]|nr:phosphoribosylpyrophosphate synthetase [Chitinophagaceae bacterium]